MVKARGASRVLARSLLTATAARAKSARPPISTAGVCMPAKGHITTSQLGALAMQRNEAGGPLPVRVRERRSAELGPYGEDRRHGRQASVCRNPR
jgi:hypothetical protein